MKHDHWFIVRDDPDPSICIRCECGERFNGFLAWSRHLLDSERAGVGT